MSGIITLSFISAEIEVQKDFDFFRSRLRFVRCCEPWLALPSGPLVSDLQDVAWSPLIRGRLPRDTTRRLDDSSRLLRDARACPSRASGVYPIFDSCRSCVVSRLRSLRGLLRRGSGGDEETRTPDPLLAKEMLFRLSYVPLHTPASGRYVVGVSGLEPETSALSGQCSNQLS